MTVIGLALQVFLASSCFADATEDLQSSSKRDRRQIDENDSIYYRQRYGLPKSLGEQSQIMLDSAAMGLKSPVLKIKPVKPHTPAEGHRRWLISIAISNKQNWMKDPKLNPIVNPHSAMSEDARGTLIELQTRYDDGYDDWFDDPILNPVVDPYVNPWPNKKDFRPQYFNTKDRKRIFGI